MKCSRHMHNTIVGLLTIIILQLYKCTKGLFLSNTNDVTQWWACRTQNSLIRLHYTMHSIT